MTRKERRKLVPDSAYHRKHFIQHYKKTHPTRGQFNSVPKAKIAAILDEWGAFLAQRLLDGHVFYLPYKLGKIYITMRKTNFNNKNGLPISKRRTVEWYRRSPEAYKHRKVVYVFNEHTNFYRYKLLWDKHHTACKNITYYKFKGVASLMKHRLYEKLMSEDPDVEKYNYQIT